MSVARRVQERRVEFAVYGRRALPIGKWVRQKARLRLGEINTARIYSRRELGPELRTSLFSGSAAENGSKDRPGRHQFRLQGDRC